MVEDLRDRGLVEVGRYENGAFEIDPDWRRKLVVYVWLIDTADGLRPVRVGIACARAGMHTRYALYNKWLAGRFKPDDAREQEVRRLMAAGLGRSALIWAVEVPDRKHGLALEEALRRSLSETLDLDLMVRGSWIKQQMNAWRLANPAGPTRPRVIAPKSPKQPASSHQSSRDLETKLNSVEQWVFRAFQRLSAEAKGVGASRTNECGPGVRYSLGRGKLVCRLHPKTRHLAIGLPETLRAEVAKHFQIRAQKGAVWFDLRDEGEVPIAADLIKDASS